MLRINIIAIVKHAITTTNSRARTCMKGNIDYFCIDTENNNFNNKTSMKLVQMKQPAAVYDSPQVWCIDLRTDSAFLLSGGVIEGLDEDDPGVDYGY